MEENTAYRSKFKAFQTYTRKRKKKLLNKKLRRKIEWLKDFKHEKRDGKFFEIYENWVWRSQGYRGNGAKNFFQFRETFQGLGVFFYEYRD